jgi:hypothetical protein
MLRANYIPEFEAWLEFRPNPDNCSFNHIQMRYDPHDKIWGTVYEIVEEENGNE